MVLQYHIWLIYTKIENLADSPEKPKEAPSESDRQPISR